MYTYNRVFVFSLPLRRKANSIHSLEPATIRLGKASSNVLAARPGQKCGQSLQTAFPKPTPGLTFQYNCTPRPVSESRFVAFLLTGRVLLVLAPYSVGSRLSSPKIAFNFSPLLILASAALFRDQHIAGMSLFEGRLMAVVHI